MLRASIQATRLRGARPTVAGAGRQWHAVPAAAGTRWYADEKKASLKDSQAAVLPGSASPSTTEPIPVGRVPTIPTAPVIPKPGSAASTIPEHNVPLIPPSPPRVTAPTTPIIKSTSTTPLPPPPAAKKPRKFFRTFFTTVFLLSTIGFGGGVFYSRVNDNFHDFFTEYVPYGEEAVLWLEEREFRQKYPLKSIGAVGRSLDTADKIKIPSKNGVSWRVADEKAPSRHANAADEKKANASEAVQTPSDATSKDKVKAVEAVKENADPVKPAPVVDHSPEPVAPSKPGHPVEKKAEAPVEKPVEAVKVTPAKQIASVSVKADEPVVDDIVKIVNDIITVVNADNAGGRYSGTLTKAKDELSKVGAKIKALKEEAISEAEKKINSERDDFERGAKQLLQEFDNMKAIQEAAWREEYEAERKRIQENYEQKLKAEIERANEVNEQRLKNNLLEQAVELKRAFIADVKSRVEEEREGRLGKLSDLSETVNELQKLTGDWNNVVDANLKTQHLHVAVEAVRANLEKSQVPRPFIRELAALKEIASDDAVVNAAIASINPTAYQRGIPSSAQLIDRFRRVASEVRKASLLPEDAGVASHAGSWVLSKLLFKKKGLATGSDVESVLTRTEMLLEEGDLDAAAREMNGLEGWAKTLSRDWMGEVRKVLEVQQALDVIATEARLQSLRVE